MIPKNTIGKDGLEVSALGFGGAPLGGLLRMVDEQQALDAVDAALDAGVTYFDTAPFYGFGRSERLIGDRLRGRDNITLSTKVGRLLKPGMPEDPAALGWPSPLPFHPVYDYSRDGILRSVEDSYQRLGLDNIDILYVHDIGTYTHGEANAAHFNDLKRSGYKALEELRSSGVVGAIGLGVNETQVLLDALEIGHWDVFLLAGRYTLLEQGPLDELLPACLKAGTDIVVGGPFNSGILVGGDTWDYAAAPPDIVDKVKRMSAVASANDVDLPAAALQFVLAHPAIVSVIPGVRSPQEFAENFHWAGTAIPENFWRDLKNEGLLREDAPVPLAPPVSRSTR